MNIKAGDKFTYESGGTVDRAKVLSVHTTNGTEWVIYEYRAGSSRDKDLEGVRSTRKELFLANWKKEEKFFVSGGVYRIPGDGCRYYVKETYRVSNPSRPKDRDKARAVVIYGDGTRSMVMLSGDDFDVLERVED